MQRKRESVGLDQTAAELARIMVEHLSEMTPEERKARIENGEKVLQKRAKGEDYIASSDTPPMTSSKSRIVRSPVAARGR